MHALSVILARSGSKGLANKNLLPLLGKPVVAYTIEEALASRHCRRVALTTDSPDIQSLGLQYQLRIVRRPPELCSDTTSIPDIAKHAVHTIEREDGFSPQFVVILYGNVPVRPPGLIDRTLDHLRRTECDSVQSYAPVGKFHPYWMSTIDGDRVSPYHPNNVYRRQDLPELFILDGGIIATTRSALFTPMAHEDDRFAFLGKDRRGLIQQDHETVDIDTQRDLFAAEAALKARALKASA